MWPSRLYSSTSPHFSSLLFSLQESFSGRRHASDESYVGHDRSQPRDGGTRAFLVINFDLIRHLGFLDRDRSVFSHLGKILFLHISSPFRSFRASFHSILLPKTRNGMASSRIHRLCAIAAFDWVAMLRAMSIGHVTLAAGFLDAVLRK